MKRLLIAGAIACLCVGSARAAFTVQADLAWQDSGMTVSAGQWYTISASGLWTGGALGQFGPTGTTWDPGYNMWVSGPHWGALVASIGQITGTVPPLSAQNDVIPVPVPALHPFLTGNSVTFEAGSSGNLFFTINDDASGSYYPDNSGSLDVQLTAVPEPTTMIAGALLLLPFGASTIRILRKKVAA